MAGAFSLIHYDVAVVVGIVVVVVVVVAAAAAAAAEIVVDPDVAELVVDADVVELVVDADVAELVELAMESLCVHFRMVNGAAVFLRPHVLLVAVAASSVLVRGVNL